MTHRLFLFAPAILLGLPAILSAQTERANGADKAALREFFEKKIRPVLAENCHSCHGAKKQSSELRFDRRDDAMKGNDDGPVIVAGHPEKSRLVIALRHKGEYKMPPKAKLPDAVIEDFAAWIKAGAYWSDEDAIAVAPGAGGTKHWAFQPVRKPALPSVKQAGWPANPVDYFILAKLEERGLQPNPPADGRTLLRRLKVDLLGLPPTYEEVAAFETDTAPNAYARLVERYLASPQYGERWARHWLDVARYADTKGYVFQEERKYPYAYTYRDYVVKAFNDDLPFDRFILEQLAADRLVATGAAERQAQAAMGFLTLGRRFLNNVHDIIDDRIDVVSRGLMGLTVACARCHDHKYDPIPQKDYYSLYGVFASSVEPKDLPLVAEPEPTKEYEAFRTKLEELERAVQDFREQNKKELDAKNRAFRDKLAALQKKVDAQKANAAGAPPRAMILTDRPAPVEPHVFHRGNPNSPGPAVPRQFLAVVSGEERKPFKDGSGRLELARAIASPANPLTARVIVNRLWLHHFGRGLVTTPSDFGVRSEPPSHPELLDWLAARLVEERWSLKQLHRLIVLSQTYRTSGAANPQASQADTDNRLLSHFPRRRLDFEAMRDSLLAVAGNLDLKMGGPPTDLLASPFSGRRTLYGFIDRQNLPGLFRTFDFASPDASSPQRYETTVPQQALFMLNAKFVHLQARALLRRPELADLRQPDAKVRALYRVIFARDADDEEVRLGVNFVAGTTKTPLAAGEIALTPWERYAQALLLTNEYAFVD
jgi:mono/diheme cytochrome c family protein